jgi:hypothetical protein
MFDMARSIFPKMLEIFSSQFPLSLFQRHNAAFLPPWLGLSLAEFTFRQKIERSRILALTLHNVFPPKFTKIEGAH